MDSRKESTTLRKDPHLDFLFEEMEQAKSADLCNPQSERSIISSKSTEGRDSADEDSTIDNNLVNLEDSLATFGTVIGLGPLIIAAVMLLSEASGPNFRNPNAGPFLLIGGIGLASTIMGSLTGRFVGKIIGNGIEQLRKDGENAVMTAVIVPFVGALWGLFSGLAAGLPIFVIGAYFGAMFGTVVGVLALTVFMIFFELVQKDRMIKKTQLYPIVFGFLATILAFMAGISLR